MLVVGRERIPAGAYPLIASIGTVLVSLGLLFNGERHGGPAGGDEMYYLWIVMWAAYHLGRKALALQVVLILAAYAATLAAIDPGPSATSRWLSLSGLVVGAAIVVRLLAERVDRLIGELRAAATSDPLTGLANRRGLEAAHAHELAQHGRTGRPFALLVLDLDRFKLINDELGHKAGDRALVNIAKLLQQHVRGGDTAARIGGDEFAVCSRTPTARRRHSSPTASRRPSATMPPSRAGPAARASGSRPRATTAARWTTSCDTRIPASTSPSARCVRARSTTLRRSAGSGAESSAHAATRHAALPPAWTGSALPLPRLVEGVRIALLAVASACAAGVALLALAHVDDRYELDHVAGAWMALAQRFADGTLYPPLYDGEQFGGTRFAPLAISLYGGAARLTRRDDRLGQAHLGAWPSRPCSRSSGRTCAVRRSAVPSPSPCSRACSWRPSACWPRSGSAATRRRWRSGWARCSARCGRPVRAASSWPASWPARPRWRRSTRSSPWRRSRSGC